MISNPSANGAIHSESYEFHVGRSTICAWRGGTILLRPSTFYPPIPAIISPRSFYARPEILGIEPGSEVRLLIRLNPFIVHYLTA